MHKLPLLQWLRAHPQFRLLQGHQIWAQIPPPSPGRLLVPVSGHGPHFQCSSWLGLQLTSKRGFWSAGDHDSCAPLGQSRSQSQAGKVTELGTGSALLRGPGSFPKVWDEPNGWLQEGKPQSISLGKCDWVPRTCTPHLNCCTQWFQPPPQYYSHGLEGGENHQFPQGIP